MTVTPTQLAINELESQIRTATEGIQTSIDAWQTQAGEQRAATETRIKELEEKVVSLSTELAEKQRTTLPGSEPEQSGEHFSMSRACRAIALRDWNEAGFEKEIFDNMRQRAMSQGSDSAGGYIVPDQVIPQVIEKLKAQVVSFQLGAREIPGTSAPITIPRLTTSATAAWINGENTTIGASDLVMDQVTMSPKTLASRVILSNQLLETSTPAADTVIEDDIASQLAVGLDQGILQGTGALGQPEGIATDSNVTTTPATDAQITYSELVEFPSLLAQQNALRGSIGWCMHPAMWAQIFTIENETNIDIQRRLLGDSTPDTLMGYRYATTTSLTGASGVGAKAIMLGNWDDVLVAMWGGLRLQASDVADSAFSADQTHIRGIMRADSVLRLPASFIVSS